MELKQIKTDLGKVHSLMVCPFSKAGHLKEGFSPLKGILLTNNFISQKNLKEMNAQVQVNIIAGHHNWIAVAYPHFVCCYKLKDGIGWQIVSLDQSSFSRRIELQDVIFSFVLDVPKHLH